MADQQTMHKAYGCEKGGEPLTLKEFSFPPLKDTHVEVKVEACGICMSDVDCVSGKYDAMGLYKYPVVAGHEGVGKVTKIGSSVQHLKVGDRVGLGVYRGCCGTCSFCLGGNNNLCNNSVMMFCGGHHGCFAELVQIDARFAIPIPDSIPPEMAAPLMCAGSTVFAPFENYSIRAGHSVGVVGIGGLGHLALQFASKMGCHVYTFSRSANKEEEARQFGSHVFVMTEDEVSKKQAVGKLDFVLVTASGANVDYKYLATCLKKNGTIIVMGATGSSDIGMSPMELVLGQKRLAGSANGSLAVYKRMIEFASLHNIRPVIKTFPSEQINEVMAKVKAGEVRYRAVLQFK